MPKPLVRVLVCTSLFGALGIHVVHGQALDSLAVLRQARQDIATLASDDFRGRGYVQQGHVRAADYIARRMQRQGLRVTRQLFMFQGQLSARVDSAWINVQIDSARTANVIGVRPGRRVRDSVLVLCAHYDHLGVLSLNGRTHLYAGANDNAAGVALLLELARRLRRFPYTVVFIAFGAEEAGLHGSHYYVHHPTPQPLAHIKEVWNLDLVGFGERGVVLVNGMTPVRDTLPPARRLLAQPEARALEPIELRPNRPNSDHWPFTQAGVAATFVFTQGGPGHYHDTLDRPPTLSLARYVTLARALEATLWSSLPAAYQPQRPKR